MVQFVTREEEGLSIVEDALLLALLALVCVAGITALGDRINTMCSTIFNSL
jgi:Flp pilus assembly pilin Flp